MRNYKKNCTKQLLARSLRSELAPVIHTADEFKADVISPKKDAFMTLGIDIDQKLIDRLENLGQGPMFTGLSNVADLLRSRQQDDSAVSSSSIIFRAPSEDNDREDLYGSLGPLVIGDESFDFSRSLLSILDLGDRGHSGALTEHMNVADIIKQSEAILRDLQDVESQTNSTEPQNRPRLKALIRKLNEHYHRRPREFVRLLLGPSSSSRFVGHLDFNDVLQSIMHPHRVPQEEISALFTLIAEWKSFEGYQDQVVDLCRFLSVLKSSGIQERRSFEKNTSRDGVNTCYWNRKDVLFQRIESGRSGVSASSTGNRQAAAAGGKTHVRAQEFQSAAEALCSESRPSSSPKNGGRGVMGSLYRETFQGLGHPHGKAQD